MPKNKNTNTNPPYSRKADTRSIHISKYKNELKGGEAGSWECICMYVFECLVRTFITLKLLIHTDIYNPAHTHTHKHLLLKE